MRRVPIFAFAAMLMLAAGVWSCAGSADNGRQLQPTMATVKPAKGYLKKIAVTLTQSPSSEVGKIMGDLFFTTLVQTIRDKDKRLLLVTPDRAEFPDFIKRPEQQPVDAINTMELAAHGRRNGYNGVIAAALRGVRPYTRKGGILWFRKVRYFISFDLTVDVYDPLTAAKVAGVVEEASVEISDMEYDAFLEGAATDVEQLQDEILDFGKQIGELVAESLKNLQWGISVVKVEGGSIYLPVGKGSGLNQGTKLAVFEGRRIVDGLEGERFIVPGPKVGTIQISSITPDGAEAAALNGGAIQAGDIAIPVK